MFSVPPPHDTPPGQEVAVGTNTVPPFADELTAVCTSDSEQEAAVTVFAWAGRHQKKTNTMKVCILNHLRDSHVGCALVIHPLA
jgi:hypothetical protein